MRTTISTLLAALALTASGAFARADIDKDEEAKKKLKEAEKAAPAGETHEELHRRLADEGKKNLDEIARLMEKIRGDLSKKQTGEATQNEQKEVLKRIQELIDQLGKGCGNPG
jgi:guanylate kinase